MSGQLVIICRSCRRRAVERARHCYAIPTCYVCLPPPAPLPIATMPRRGGAQP